MGCDSFVVRLKLPTEDRTGVDGWLNGRGFVPNMGKSGHPQWILRTPPLVAEALLSDSSLSVQFAVCHPHSSVSVFADLVCQGARVLQADVVVLEDMPTRLPFEFSWGDDEGIKTGIMAAFAIKRWYWSTDFGGEAVITCREALERFVYPKGQRYRGPPI